MQTKFKFDSKVSSVYQWAKSVRSRMNNNYIHCRLYLSWLQTGYVRLNKLILHRLDFSVFLSSFYMVFFWFFFFLDFFILCFLFVFFSFYLIFNFFCVDFFSFVYNEIIIDTVYYNVRDIKILTIFSLLISQIFCRKHVSSNYIHL